MEFSQFWRNTTNDHCDLVISSLMRHFKMYAPDPLLIGQDGGHSDVTNRKEWLRFLAPEQKESIGRSDPRHSIQRLVVAISAKRAAVPAAAALLRRGLLKRLPEFRIIRVIQVTALNQQNVYPPPDRIDPRLGCRLSRHARKCRARASR